jgi:hypothetical protein
MQKITTWNSNTLRNLSGGMRAVKKREMKVMTLKVCIVAPNVRPVSEICLGNVEIQ